MWELEPWWWIDTCLWGFVIVLRNAKSGLWSCISVVFTKMVKDTAIFGEEKRKCNIRGGNLPPHNIRELYTCWELFFILYKYPIKVKNPIDITNMSMGFCNFAAPRRIAPQALSNKRFLLNSGRKEWLLMGYIYSIPWRMKVLDLIERMKHV